MIETIPTTTQDMRKTGRRKADDDFQQIIDMINSLGHKFDLFVVAQDACHKGIDADLSAVVKKVNGNGQDGLSVRVDRLEVFMADLKKTLNFIAVGVVMILITAIMNLILR
jgi:DNA replicative helicase MCM subunit Mcm2 (Cdc46/Mcm family)